MQFCDFCNNMLYIKVDEDNHLNVSMYCKNCKYNQELSKENTQKLYIQNMYNRDNYSYDQYLNKNIEYDRTIPHINNIECIYEDCTKKKTEDNDIMYIKYDEINMKYLYYCVHCKQFWKN
jgi:DNA-directed RNA polymerase subunit M/transcription elongation factor TFIIS